MKNKVIDILNNNSQKSVIGWAVEIDDFDKVAQDIVKLFAIPVVSNNEVAVCERCKKLEFMIENGLGWKDMENDCT